MEIPKGTLLSDAGTPAAEIGARDHQNQAALDELRAVLAPKRTGRPRNAVATYYLPIAGLMLLNDWRATLSLPRRLRPLMWQIHQQMRLKHRNLLTPEMRRKNMANGTYAPETERKYRRLLERPRPLKGPGLFSFKPEDQDGRRSAILNPLPLMILPQFYSK